MFRWLKIGLLALGATFTFVVFLAVGLYYHQYNSVVQETTGQIEQWKKSDWLLSARFDLLTKALVSAEDASFLEHPRVNCGLSALLKAIVKPDVSEDCSPIISYAARLATARIYDTRSTRKFAELSMQNELSKRPTESLDLILSRTYLGQQKDGAAIEGFQQAAKFYFNESIEGLKISKLALLAGMVRAPGRFSPDRASEKAKLRRDAVIEQMAASGYISKNEAESAKQEPLR